MGAVHLMQILGENMRDGEQASEEFLNAVREVQRRLSCAERHAVSQHLAEF